MKTNNQNIDNWQNKRLKNLNLLIFPTPHLNNIIFHFSIHFSHSRTILSKLVNVWKTKMKITRNMQFPGIHDPSRKKYKCKNKRTDDRRKRIKGRRRFIGADVTNGRWLQYFQLPKRKGVGQKKGLTLYCQKNINTLSYCIYFHINILDFYFVLYY